MDRSCADALEAEHHDFRESFRTFLHRAHCPGVSSGSRTASSTRVLGEKPPSWGSSLRGAAEHGGSDLVDFRFNAIANEEVARAGAATDSLR